MQRTSMFEQWTENKALKGKIKYLPCIKALDFSAALKWTWQEKEDFLEGMGDKSEEWADDGYCFAFNLIDQR